jgi:glutamine cyclotransferase
MKKIIITTINFQLFLILLFAVFVYSSANTQNVKYLTDNDLNGYYDEISQQSINGYSDYTVTQKDTGDVVSTIPAPGPNSEGLTWDGSNLWCSDIINDYIYKLDPLDGSILYSFASLSDRIEGLAWDGTYLWGADNTSDIVFKYDPANGTVISSMQYTDIWIHGITWDGQYLWMNDFQNKVIYKTNPETGEILFTINSPEDNCIGLTWDGFHLWTGDFSTDKLYCLNPADGSVLYEVNSPTSNPRDLAWDGEYLWVMSWEDATIYQLDVGEISSAGNSFLIQQSKGSLLIYPNPAVEEVNIEFIVTESSKVLISIYNQTGSLTKTVVNKIYFPGKYSVKWDGKTDFNKRLSQGVYYCVLHCNEKTQSRKFVVK